MNIADYSGGEAAIGVIGLATQDPDIPFLKQIVGSGWLISLQINALCNA